MIDRQLHAAKGHAEAVGLRDVHVSVLRQRPSYLRDELPSAGRVSRRPRPERGQTHVSTLWHLTAHHVARRRRGGTRVHYAHRNSRRGDTRRSVAGGAGQDKRNAKERRGTEG